LEIIGKSKLIQLVYLQVLCDIKIIIKLLVLMHSIILYCISYMPV
jgi:hypothetical protein